MTKSVATITSNEEAVRLRIFDGDLPLDAAGAELLRIERAQHEVTRATVRDLVAELVRIKSAAAWRPINEAPVLSATEVNPWIYKFHCLLQDRREVVYQGEAHYVQLSRSKGSWRLRWYRATGHLCDPQPLFWMPLPDSMEIKDDG